MKTFDNHTFAVCAYGESPYLTECLDSLLAQTVKSRILIATATPNEFIRRTAAQCVERYHDMGCLPASALLP